MFTLALGYLTCPVSIETSLQSVMTPSNPSPWSLGNTLSIVCFVSKPPTLYPTVAKHILTMDPLGTRAEHELYGLLLSSLNPQAEQRLWAMILLEDGLVGILGAGQHHKLTLQLVEPTKEPIQTLPSFNPQSPSYGPRLSSESLMGHPLHILQLCQQWPESGASAQLCSIAQEIYQVATLYGYWDLWRVLDGICKRFNIDPQQLLKP
ncbi:hypothetical protein BDF14DRAFT_159718 [Spinellus fusiger]|nr:hypothetical protein BDF14DRAFT_159718 [Spinellus fusiger]